MKRSSLLVSLLLIIVCRINAQTAAEIQVQFSPVWQGDILRLEEPYKTTAGDTVSFREIRFYISAVSLWQQGKMVWQEQKSYHLMDVAVPSSLLLYLPMYSGKVDELRFYLGIDSITNVSGAMDGDLDPVKGMYWTWQSGYINCKLEGFSNRCPARKHLFQFHLGGYSGDRNALQQVRLPLFDHSPWHIQIPLDEWLASIDLSRQYEMMIPGKEAVVLSRKLAEHFKIIKQ